MGFKITEPFAIGDPTGGMGCKATWDGEGSSAANLKIPGRQSDLTFGVCYTTDFALPASQWTPWVVYDGVTKKNTPLPVALGMPVYFFPWYQATPGAPKRYSNVITDLGGNANATSNDNGSAGITITMIGVGGGGPDEDA